MQFSIAKLQVQLQYSNPADNLLKMLCKPIHPSIFFRRTNSQTTIVVIAYKNESLTFIGRNLSNGEKLTK